MFGPSRHAGWLVRVRDSWDVVKLGSILDGVQSAQEATAGLAGTSTSPPVREERAEYVGDLHQRGWLFLNRLVGSEYVGENESGIKIAVVEVALIS